MGASTSMARSPVAAGRALPTPCKWSADLFRPEGILAFGRAYPNAVLAVVAQDVDRPFRRRYADREVEFLGLPGLIQRVRS